jgi:hypothetical protein
MSVVLADNISNPYTSPRASGAPLPAPAAPVTKPGSIGIVLGGFVLLLLGYFTSNLFLISDLYHIGMGPDGKAIPSPLAAVFTTAPQQWGMYALCAAAFVAGAVMIGSQRFNPMAVVCYVMCPLVGMIYLIASPLRIVKKNAELVAALYLLVGSCLAISGITQLLRLYGQNGGGFAPIAASMMTEAGLAFVVGSALKFMASEPDDASSQDDAIIVAEFAEGNAAQS